MTDHEDNSPTLVAVPSAEAATELRERLEGEGFSVAAVTSAAEALDAMETDAFRVVLASVVLRVGKDAQPLVRQISDRWPHVPVVGLLEEPGGAGVLAAMRCGAADAIDRHAPARDLAVVLNRVLATAPDADDVPPFVDGPATTLLGKSELMVNLRGQIDRAAAGTATVLVRGESGTGKELVARAIHSRSSRAQKPFVKVNCAGLPETLLDSELFGHERGAFTGAVRTKPGRLETTGDGTLFLDEIGDITPLTQVKLLRVLQDREYERLGSNEPRKTGARFITATHRDLEAMIADGSFREDLFYRLNVVPLWVPPLRARRDDIELLARHFFDRFAKSNGRDDLVLREDAMATLVKQRWAGNVRELQNVVERVVVMCTGPEVTSAVVTDEMRERAHFSTQALASLGRTDGSGAPSAVLPLDDEMRAAEKRALERALGRAGGSRAKAARLLGIGRTTLYRKMTEHGLS